MAASALRLDPPVPLDDRFQRRTLRQAQPPSPNLSHDAPHLGEGRVRRSDMPTNRSAYIQSRKSLAAIFIKLPAAPSAGSGLFPLAATDV